MQVCGALPEGAGSGSKKKTQQKHQPHRFPRDRSFGGSIFREISVSCKGWTQAAVRLIQPTQLVRFQSTFGLVLNHLSVNSAIVYL